jgi:MFS family permease
MFAKSRFLIISCVDGCFYALMSCFSEALALVYLAQTGISSSLLGMFTTVPPAMGALFQIVMPYFFGRFSAVTLTLCSVLVQIAGLCVMTGAVFGDGNLAAMGIGLCLYWMGGMGAGAPWQVWIASLLRPEEQNVFFAKRAIASNFVMLGAFLATGLFLRNYNIQKAIPTFFTVAVVCRCISLWSLVKHPRLSFSLPACTKPRSFCFFERNEAGVCLLVICLMNLAWRFAVSTSSPFYNPYMLKELQMSVGEVTLLNAVPILVRVFVGANWGKLLDERRTYEGLLLSMGGAALLPMLWALGSSQNYLTILQVMSGVVWCGYEFIIGLLVQRLFPGAALMALALFSASGAFGSTLGALCGGWAIDMGLSHKGTFEFSSAARLITGGIFLCYLRHKGAFRFRNLDLRAGMATVFSIRPSLAALGRVFYFGVRKLK